METPSPRTLDVMLGWGSHISAAKCARATSPKPGRQASLLCSYPGHLGLHPAPGRGGAGMTIGLFLIANGNNLFSSVFWKKSLKRKSDAREATSGDANKTGKDIPVSRDQSQGLHSASSRKTRIPASGNF